MKKLLLTMTRIADTTTVNFFENGNLIAVLEEKMLAEDIFDIQVSSVQNPYGRLICIVIGDQISLVGNHFVIGWIDNCKTHLRLPL